MGKSKKRILVWIGGFIILYAGVCLTYYSFQESLIFHPKKLSSEHIFLCDKNFEELTINTSEGYELNGVLVKADSSKGLILFLHGSGGNIDKYIAKRKLDSIYTDLDYDIFLLDYRGYGKSEGRIKNEKLFTDDLDLVYSHLKKRYDEKEIVIIGFSLGTFAASFAMGIKNDDIAEGLASLSSSTTSTLERRSTFACLRFSLFSFLALSAFANPALSN